MMHKPNAFELTPELALLYENICNQPFSRLRQKTLDQPVFIHNLIVNALASPEKCLILSQDTKIFDELIEFLEAQNLHNFGLVLEDHLSHDFSSRLKQHETPIKREKNFTAQQFDLHYTNLLRLQPQFRKKYIALRTPVFGDLNWPDLLGLTLLSQAELGNEAFNLVLSQDGFSFTLEELSTALEILNQGQQLYEAVSRQDHPLKALHVHIFLRKERQEAQLFTALKLNAYQQRLNSLIQKFQQTQSIYSQLLREHLEQKIKSFLNRLDQILDQVEEKVGQYGPKYLEAKTGKTNWFTHLSGQGKLQIQDYRQIKAEYDALRKDFEQTQWFAFNWPNSAKLTTLHLIKTTLESFESSLKLWQADLWRFIQEEELRLNAKFALPELGQKERIMALEEEMEELIEDLNETQLLNAKLEHNMLTLAKRNQYLSQLQQQLQQLSAHLDDFPAFYKWQGFWLNQQALHQELMRKLIEAKAKEWDISFKIWYWRQVLYRSRQKDLPNDGSPDLHSYYQWWNGYKQMLLDQILRLKIKDSVHAVRQFKKLKKQPQPIALENLQDLDWKAMTDLYPILMLNKWSTATFAGMDAQQKFDWVLVVEHSHNNKGALELYRKLGKRVLVFAEETVGAKEEYVEASNPSVLKVSAQEGFWTSFIKAILPYFGVQRIERSVLIADMVLPLILKPEQEGKPGFVFLQDGFLSTLEVTDFAWEAAQQKRLQEAGWELIYVWSEECWKNLHETCRKIAAEIISKEKKIHFG